MYCAMNPGLLFSMVYIMWFPAIYPGAHAGNATFWVLAMFPVAALYWLFSVSMPRSGGEYLYISRILHPSLGLIASFIISLTAISWNGILTDWWVQWALSDLFRGLALTTGNAGLNTIADAIRTPIWRTVIGAAALALTGYIFMKGAKMMMRLAYWAVGISLLGALVWLIGGLANAGNFAANWEAMTGTSTQQIIDAAAAGGFALNPTFLATMMGGVTYVCLNTLGSTFSANMAGEIRGVEKTQMMALFGSLLIQMFMWWLVYQGSYWIMGQQFTNSLMWAYFSGDAAYPLPNEPFPTVLIAILSRSSLLVILIAVSFFFSTFMSGAGLAYGPTRNIFAWAFDRMLPAKFSEMHRKWRVPMTTIWVTVFVAWLFNLMNIWAPTWTANIAYTIATWFVAWILLGLAGVLFPFVKRDLFAASPPVVRSRFLGIPVVSLLGLLTIAVSLFVEYSLFYAWVQAGIPTTVWWMVAAFVIIPVVIYLVAKSYHSSRGVPLESQFAQIPPE